MSDPPAHKRLRPAGEDGEEEDPAVTRFREYLRIPTISATENTNSAYGEQSTVKSQDKLVSRSQAESGYARLG